MKFTLSRRSPTQLKTPCLIVGVSETGGLTETAQQIDEATEGRLSRLLKRGDVCTKLGSYYPWSDPPGIAASRVLIVGAGNPEKFAASHFRKASVAATRYLSENGWRRISPGCRERRYPRETPSTKGSGTLIED